MSPDEGGGAGPAEQGPAEQDPAEQAPLLRVVGADATPEEIAALVAVLSSLGGGTAPTRRRTPSWNAPHRLVRTTHRSGPGGWRGSALPR